MIQPIVSYLRMKDIIKNNLENYGYTIVKNAFTEIETKNLISIFENPELKQFLTLDKNNCGFTTKNGKKDNLQDLLKSDSNMNKEIINHALSSFEKTKFFKENLSNFETNGWNGLRVNVPSQKFKNVCWHQDIQTPIENKMDIEDKKFYTFWIPFSSVNENNSIEIVNMPFTNKVFHNHYKINIPLPKIYRNSKIHKVKISLGDLVILNNSTFHRSTWNQSNFIRISADLRYTNNEKINFDITFPLRMRMLKSKIKDIIQKSN